MADLRERLLHPRQGWLSLGLLAVMMLALAWSVQGAAWLAQLDFLAPVALYAVVAGALIGILPMSVALTLPASALLGTLVVVWTVGGEYFPLLDQGERLMELRTELVGWTAIVLRTGYPPQLMPYALGLGVLLWTTGFIAAYAVYRHNRVLDAILIVGVLIVANMAATLADLFVHLLIFVIAALLLWLRAALSTREEGWQRRRVNENLEVPTAIMRSGIAFGAGSIALAWILTSVAVAAPLTEAWRGMDGVWTDVRDRFEGVFGQLTNPQARITGTSFGSGFVVDGSWVSNDEEVLRLAAPRPLYLRTATYDVYTGRGFERSPGSRRDVVAGERLFPGETPERPQIGDDLADAFEIETITIEMINPVGRNLFVPGYPMRIFAPARIHQSADAPVLGGLDSVGGISPGQQYAVDAAISAATEAQLRLAGTEYPDLVRELYLDDSRVTDRVAELARQVTEAADTPYDQGRLLARYLSRHESFTYSTTAPVPSPDQDLVDFFLFDPEGRRGFCQYYAATMVMLARSLGIPGRVAVGFAPGERVEEGISLVREANAHAWAELYFPGFGWQIFEATKSINPGFNRPAGEQLAAPPDRPLPGDNLLERFEAGFDRDTIREFPSFNPVEGGIDPRTGEPVADGSSRGGNTLVFLAIVVAALGAIWYRMRSRRRRWRFLPPGERTWRHLALAAERAGVTQRPSETIYEYAGWLEEQIPSRSGEIRVIADGKVWQSYSGRRMGRTAVERLEAAWRRLRMPFVRLAARQWVRTLLRR